MAKMKFTWRIVRQVFWVSNVMHMDATIFHDPSMFEEPDLISRCATLLVCR
jgi:hypothetical protein